MGFVQKEILSKSKAKKEAAQNGVMPSSEATYKPILNRIFGNSGLMEKMSQSQLTVDLVCRGIENR